MIAPVTAAVVFTWLGMVLAISFVEAPLKFRAPDVTPRIGLGIGRIVFRALNILELVFAAALVTILGITAGTQGMPNWGLPLIALIIVLGVQLIGIRPVLNKRSDRVLAGETLPRSRVHLLYVAAEALKLVILVIVGVLALTAAQN